MFRLVFHVCTSESNRQQEKMQCCHPKSEVPKCCQSDNKSDVEPAFCCDNIQFYYFTPKYNDGFKKQLNIPTQSFVILEDHKNYHSLNQLAQTNLFAEHKSHHPPPLHSPNLEKICVWII